MHIILISNTNENNSGWGTMTHNHCLALRNRGVKFTLLLPKKNRKIETPYHNNVKYILPDLPLSFNSVKGLIKLPLLYKKYSITNSQKAVVHSLIDFPYAVLGYKMARKNKYPFVFTAHGTYSVAPFTKRIDRYLMIDAYKNSNAIITVSNFTAFQMQELSKYKRDINVMLNPVSLPVELGKEDFSVINLLPNNKKIILSVSALKLRKGVDILMTAFAIALKQDPNLFLVIVGKGNTAKYINLSKALKIYDSLKILNGISPKQLSALFVKCSLFIMTPIFTNYEFEGYGLVYLEAGLYKKPVIGSMSGGVPEAVINNETGILVPENDPEATAKAIINILKNKSLAEKLGDNGYKLAKQRNWVDYINKVIKIYESVCS